MKCPAFFVCALCDPSVPPPGQFAVWKAHPGPKALFVKAKGHLPGAEGDVPPRGKMSCVLIAHRAEAIDAKWLSFFLF